MKTAILIATLSLLCATARADVLMTYRIASWGQGNQVTVAERHATFEEAQQSLIRQLSVTEANNASPFTATKLYLLDVLITVYPSPLDALLESQEPPVVEFATP